MIQLRKIGLLETEDGIILYACHLKGLESTSITRSLRVSHPTQKEQLLRNPKDIICVSVACGFSPSSILSVFPDTATVTACRLFAI